MIFLSLMSTTDTPSGDNKEEDEAEKQWYEDGYRKMGDGDETVLYVAVPLQAGTSLV